MSLQALSYYQDLSNSRLPTLNLDTATEVQCGQWSCGSTGYCCPLCAVKCLVGLYLSEQVLSPLSVSRRWSDFQSRLDEALRTSSTYLASGGGGCGVPSNTLLRGPSYRDLYGLPQDVQEYSL